MLQCLPQQRLALPRSLAKMVFQRRLVGDHDNIAITGTSFDREGFGFILAGRHRQRSNSAGRKLVSGSQ